MKTLVVSYLLLLNVVRITAGPVVTPALLIPPPMNTENLAGPTFNFVRSRRQSSDDNDYGEVSGDIQKSSSPHPPSGMKPTETPSKHEISANTSIINMDKSKATFVDALVKCMGPTKHCSLTSLKSHICFLACVVDPFPPIKNLLNIFEPVVRSLCRPIGTIFDIRLGRMRDYFGDFQHLPTYSDIQMDPESFAYEMDSLLFQIIRFGKSPIADLLKPVIGTLSTILQASVTPGAMGIPDLLNPKCHSSDINLGLHMLADTAISHSFAVDVHLPGWFIAMNLFNLNLGPIEGSIQAITAMAKTFMGTECDLVGYSNTGVVADCNKILGKIKPLPKPAKIDQDFICGTLPDLPSVDLHTLLPDVVPSEQGGGNGV